MNTKSRTVNTIINISTSVGTQVLLLLLSFITRTIFIYQIGVEYLGINGLYINLLTVLSLADLGLGTAMVYTLYKPIANKEYSALTSLLRYYKKVYRVLALVVLVLGLGLMPFLDYIMDVDIEINKLRLFYLMFLANTVLSYLIAYKATIMKADQRLYILSSYKFFVEIFRNIIQILTLLFTQSFFLYLLVQLISTLINNIVISNKVNKLYPFIKDKVDTINNETKKVIFSNVKAIFIYRIGGVILNSTDNIVISILIGTIWVGYYSNYYLIVGSIITICGLFFNSFVSSVGNLNATNIEDGEPIFKIINFLNFWVYGVSSIAVFILISDFIYLWLGESFILNKSIVTAIVLNIYIPGMLQGVSTFRDTTELFKKTKYVYLVTAILNLFLSIFLGIEYGLAGILFATAIARLLTNFWFEPFMLYKVIFKKRCIKFYLQQVNYGALVGLVAVILELIVISTFSENITYTIFFIKTVLVLLITNLSFYIFYRNSDEYKFIRQRLINIYIIGKNKAQKQFSHS